MTEALIKDSLISLTTAMGAPTAGASHEQAEQITRALETLDTLFASERPHLHPQLAHFLQHRSYAKALDFLGGPEGSIPPSASKPQRPSPTAS